MYYDRLPEVPIDWTIANVISRWIDGIGYRYANATNGLPDDLADYRVTESAMSMIEVIKHCYDLIYWVGVNFDSSLRYNKQLSSISDYRDSTLSLCHHIRTYISGLSDEELRWVTLYLKRTDTYFPIWYFFNGPMADVLTHIGQINSWRRAAGHPCAPISPLSGERFGR